VAIESVSIAINQIAQTTLRAVIGRHTLDESLSEVEKINEDLRAILDVQTESWGVRVSIVELRDIQLPETMKRAMAKQAEAEREKRAKIIVDRAMAIGAGTIYLAGYSRGGSAAVIAAQMLADKGVPVTGLFLFDPVARHGSASSDVVPANVAAAFTARRAIGAPQMDKYDWALLGDLAGHNPVRNWFGTTATQFASPSTQRRDTVEVGSHGALGGVGWKGVSEDIPCQEAVARFFNQALREQQLPIQIESRTPVSSL
jgi:pimeloyl-ACP methyl ester carboxylesterase